MALAIQFIFSNILSTRFGLFCCFRLPWHAVQIFFDKIVPKSVLLDSAQTLCMCHFMHAANIHKKAFAVQTLCRGFD